MMNIAEIKQLVSIFDVLEYYGFGRTKEGDMLICPFHNDKNPSLKVNEDSVHCFGCRGVNHWDIIDFIKQKEHCETIEAMNIAKTIVSIYDKDEVEYVELNEIIEKAKRKVEEKDRDIGRKWLEATPPNSYGDPRYKLTLFVLEGSPPKGYVIVDYCYKRAWAFDKEMNPIQIWEGTHSDLIVGI